MTSSALEALVGQTLDGHYRLDKLLGAGGMGAVYKAHHTGLQRDVAIKILHPDIGADESISKRFDREAHSASRLDHPNCVRVSDFGTTAEGVKYLVMELLVGGELGARLGQPWAPEAACEILDQILAGLDHAHQNGIVHRDLKPENVFLSQQGGQEIAKIVDFGIAKLLDAEGAAEVLTRAGMVFGTPRYMSPEQAAGGKIDARSDLYSVGVLAYVMLAGRLPFDGDDLAAVLRMHIMAPPPPLPDTVPAPLAAWVESLLEKSRHERPESAAVARERLAEVRKQLERSPTTPTVANTTAPSFDPLAATGAHTAMDLAMDLAATTAPPSADDPLPSKPEAMLGHRVASRFALQELLGIGGMGAVFRAQDSQTGAIVAVKVLHAALAEDEEIAARFTREANTASELEHPNIVPVFSHGTTPAIGGEARYLVMPLLEGVELRALIGAPLEPMRACTLIVQLLDALACAHAREVVHRDLKPENVFVIRDEAGHEQIQLVDFGLAKVAEAGRSYRALTAFGQVFGTPAYMSPEQCRGEIVDARTDVYAVGVMLYELLAGHAPFEAGSPLLLLTMQVHDAPPPLPEQVPASLRAIVGSMLVKDREQRMPSASAAAEALRAAMASNFAPAVSAPVPAAVVNETLLPVTVPAPPATTLASPLAVWWQTVPRTWVYAGAGVLALLIIIAVWPSGTPPAEDETSADEAPTVTPPPTPTISEVFGGPAKAGEDVYIELDRLLTAKDQSALDRIRALRDEFPGDGQLMWREARALELVGGEANRVAALHRYAEAAKAEPELAQDTEFTANLRNLLRDPKLRQTAFDVAVRELGGLGHTFLLEQLNQLDGDARELGYVDRHRALDELARDPAMLARVNHQRQLILDLRQAQQAPAACGAFGEALDGIAKDGDAAFLPALYDRNLAIPESPGVQDQPSACNGLADKLTAVRDELASKHPDAAAKAQSKSGKKKGKKGGGFRLPF